MLSPEFKSVIDLYCEEEKKRGKKSTTIYTESHNASTFFLSLQQKGINSLNKATEEAVLFNIYVTGRNAAQELLL